MAEMYEQHDEQEMPEGDDWITEIEDGSGMTLYEDADEWAASEIDETTPWWQEFRSRQK